MRFYWNTDKHREKSHLLHVSHHYTCKNACVVWKFGNIACKWKAMTKITWDVS